TVPGSAAIPSTEIKAYRSSGVTVAPCTIFRFVGIRASSLPEAKSITETDWSRRFVAISFASSFVSARLYTPGRAGMRRTSFQVLVSTSTISLDPLQATNTDDRLPEGCAHVGEQEISPGLGGSVPWPLAAAASWFVFDICIGGPGIPASLPFVSTK